MNTAIPYDEIGTLFLDVGNDILLELLQKNIYK